MFSFRDYMLKGFIASIGKMEDYQIILNSGAYREKGVLTEDDLDKIERLIDAKNAALQRPSNPEEQDGYFYEEPEDVDPEEQNTSDIENPEDEDSQ